MAKRFKFYDVSCQKSYSVSSTKVCYYTVMNPRTKSKVTILKSVCPKGHELRRIASAGQTHGLKRCPSRSGRTYTRSRSRSRSRSRKGNEFKLWCLACKKYRYRAPNHVCYKSMKDKNGNTIWMLKSDCPNCKHVLSQRVSKSDLPALRKKIKSCGKTDILNQKKARRSRSRSQKRRSRSRSRKRSSRSRSRKRSSRSRSRKRRSRSRSQKRSSRSRTKSKTGVPPKTGVKQPLLAIAY